MTSDTSRIAMHFNTYDFTFDLSCDHMHIQPPSHTQLEYINYGLFELVLDDLPILSSYEFVSW